VTLPYVGPFPAPV